MLVVLVLLKVMFSLSLWLDPLLVNLLIYVFFNWSRFLKQIQVMPRDSFNSGLRQLL